MIEVSRQYYDRDKATYHVSADIRKLPSPDGCSRCCRARENYLERWSDVPAGKGFTEPAGKCCIARLARSSWTRNLALRFGNCSNRTTIRTPKSLPIISSGIYAHLTRHCDVAHFDASSYLHVGLKYHRALHS